CVEVQKQCLEARTPQLAVDARGAAGAGTPPGRPWTRCSADDTGQKLRQIVDCRADKICGQNGMSARTGVRARLRPSGMQPQRQENVELSSQCARHVTPEQRVVLRMCGRGWQGGRVGLDDGACPDCRAMRVTRPSGAMCAFSVRVRDRVLRPYLEGSSLRTRIFVAHFANPAAPFQPPYRSTGWYSSRVRPEAMSARRSRLCRPALNFQAVPALSKNTVKLRQLQGVAVGTGSEPSGVQRGRMRHLVKLKWPEAQRGGADDAARWQLELAQGLRMPVAVENMRRLTPRAARACCRRTFARLQQEAEILPWCLPAVRPLPTNGCGPIGKRRCALQVLEGAELRVLRRRLSGSTVSRRVGTAAAASGFERLPRTAGRQLRETYKLPFKRLASPAPRSTPHHRSSNVSKRPLTDARQMPVDKYRQNCVGFGPREWPCMTARCPETDFDAISCRQTVKAADFHAPVFHGFDSAFIWSLRFSPWALTPKPYATKERRDRYRRELQELSKRLEASAGIVRDGLLKKFEALEGCIRHRVATGLAAAWQQKEGGGVMENDGSDKGWGCTPRRFTAATSNSNVLEVNCGSRTGRVRASRRDCADIRYPALGLEALEDARQRKQRALTPVAKVHDAESSQRSPKAMADPPPSSGVSSQASVGTPARAAAAASVRFDLATLTIKQQPEPIATDSVRFDPCRQPPEQPPAASVRFDPADSPPRASRRLNPARKEPALNSRPQAARKATSVGDSEEHPLASDALLNEPPRSELHPAFPSLPNSRLARLGLPASVSRRAGEAANESVSIVDPNCRYRNGGPATDEPETPTSSADDPAVEDRIRDLAISFGQRCGYD
uniref:MADF domain-containing protein n=1 Tax=Macrostomum lignano TaxID=282301 RepID=A0A1I8JPN2_9PLAT